MMTWRKSSYSGGGGVDGQECVEVAQLSGWVDVRDSKAPGADHLSLAHSAFAGLLARVKRDEFMS